MSRKKQTPIFWYGPNGQRAPVNRAAKREIEAARRKCLVDPSQHTKRNTRGRAHQREPGPLVELRRKIAAEWRRTRRQAWYMYA